MPSNDDLIRHYPGNVKAHTLISLMAFNAQKEIARDDY